MFSTKLIAGSRWLGISLAGLALLAGVQGTAAVAADAFLRIPGSVVSGLAMRNDMRPAAIRDHSIAIPAVPTGSISTGFLARQSVPASDRSASYGGGGLFANSKTVLPLLVADLQPQLPSTVRPMSGRSVGARPAALWARTPGLVGQPVQAQAASRPTGASWANLR